MAIDNWLLDQCIKGALPSTLRFYTWRAPTISLGYHQRQFPPHWRNLSWHGQPVSLVRRPTGGRAVLHQGDLTYAIITAAQKGCSRRKTYQQLCQFLIQGWQQLGISLSFGKAKRGYIQNPNCFGTATAADLILSNGYKLIGSAQVYREGYVLQHGSMRLGADSELFEQVFDEQVTPPPELTTLLTSYSMGAIAHTLTESASLCYQANFTVMPLSKQERKAAMAGQQFAQQRLKDL